MTQERINVFFGIAGIASGNTENVTGNRPNEQLQINGQGSQLQGPTVWVSMILEPEAAQ